MQEPRASARGVSAIFARGFARAAVLLVASLAAMQAARAQVIFNRVPTTLGSGFLTPSGVAVDANGNVYVADSNNNAVKEMVAAGGYATVNTVGSGFAYPTGVAVDGGGNVYVADPSLNAVDEILAAGGYTTVTPLGSGFAGPQGVAVDGGGNVYVADSGNSEVKEIPASCISGANNASCVVTLGSGFNGPVGVTLDRNGNVYVADSGNNAVKEILAAGGYTTVNIIATGFDFPKGVAVDGGGNVYVVDIANNAVKEIVTAGGNTLGIMDLGGGLNQPRGVAVDGNGNLYVADAGNNRVVELSPTLASVDLGAQVVGTTSASVSVPFTIAAGSTVGSIAVLTTGTVGPDFANAGTGTCTAGTYTVATACTVAVTSTPHEPGVRNGAVEILDGAGNVLTSLYIYDIGTGPAVVFSPTAALTALGSGFNEPTGVTKDSSSNVFVADTFNNAVKEILAPGFTMINVLGSGFNNPFGVAVDGAGNVFVADTNNNAVKEILAASGYVTVNNLGSGFLGPYGVTVDGSGNVYVADTGNSLVKEILAVGGYTTVLTLGSGFNQPEGVALDGSGNVFVADTYNQAVKEILAAGGYTTVNTLGSGFSYPRTVALDASGNVYVADANNNAIKQILAAGGYATVNVLATGLNQPFGVVVGGAGDLIFSNSGVNLVEQMVRSQPPSLAFGSTNVFTASNSSPLSATVQNVGNTALTVTSLTLSDGVDFAQVAGLGTPEDCTGTIVLAPSVECNLSVSFTPQSVGALGGKITLTDDTLNVPGATQPIALSGTGVTIPTTLTLTTSAISVAVGGQVTFTATLIPYMAQGASTNGESVNFIVAEPIQTLPLEATLEGGVATLNLNLTEVGTTTVSANYEAADNVFMSSIANNVVITVTPPITTTALAITSAGNAVTSVASGSVVTLSATVTTGTGAVTTGTVNFCNAAATYCTDINLVGTAQLNTDGTASISLVPGIGSHSYKAVFVGTTNYNISASAASPLAVTGAFPTTTTIAASGAPGDYTLTATLVGSVSSGAAGPTGTMSFLNTSNANYSLATATIGAGTLAQSFAPAVSYATGLEPQSAAVGDFNGDGIPDLVVANGTGNTVSVLLGNANGTFQPEVTYATGTYSLSVVVADFNGDGILDLAVANLLDNTVSVLLGNGDGTFQPQVTYPVGTAPASVAVGDFNGDGIPDLAVANTDSDTAGVSVLLGRGDGTFNAQVTYATGGLPQSVAVGDFNGDGFPDLAVSIPSSNTVSVLLGNGDGTFQPPAGYATGSNPYSEAVGDFNRDGVLDLAVANLDGDSVSVLLGNGNGTFQPQVTYATGNLTYSVAVGDFNADGIPDLVAISNGADPVSVLLGNGDGTFQPPVAYAIGSGPQFVALGDFNGDGLPDLAVVNNGLNTVSILLDQLTETATATATGVAVTGAGMQNVEASYPGGANYGTSVSAITPLTAQPVATTLTLSAGPANITFGQPAMLTATLSPYTSQGYTTNGEAVTFMSNGLALGTAALQTGTATLVTSTLQGGSNQLAASFAGDANFAAAPGAEAIVVNPAGQTITFGAIPGQVVGTPLTLSASASSGLAVSFTSSTTGVCTVAGNLATMLTIGTCSITASQAGNGNFAAASPITQNFAVVGQPQTITFTGLPSVAAYAPGLAYTLNGTASSGLPVSYTMTGPATLSASTLTIIGAGTVTVTASQPGNTIYAAATPVAQTTVVVLAPMITSQPNIGVSGVNPGQTATITVVATGTPPLLYQWFQGTNPITTNPIQGAVNSSYTTPPLTVATNYWVQISNLGGVVDSATLLVYVNQPPVCTLSVAGTSTALQVSATASCADPQNQLLTATINWGDGTSGPLTGTTQLHTYSAAGTYTVVVTATDTSGLSGSAQQRITPNQLPVCTLKAVQGTAATYAVSVPASCTDPQNEALTATINWGDGTIAPATNNASNTHTYATSGIYTVVLSATDASGLVGVSVPQAVNVLVQAAPIAPGGSVPVSGTAPAPLTTVVGTQVTFICSSVSFVLNGQAVDNVLPSQYGISCTSPTITLTPAPTPINVTIQTTTAATATAKNRDSETTRVVCAVVFPLPALALLLLGTISPGQRRRRRDQWLAIGMVAVLCFGLTSCGGSFTPPPVTSTPAGQYYVTVVEAVVTPPTPTGFVQTSLIVPLPVTSSAGN